MMMMVMDAKASTYSRPRAEQYCRQKQSTILAASRTSPGVVATEGCEEASISYSLIKRNTGGSYKSQG